MFEKFLVEKGENNRLIIRYQKNENEGFIKSILKSVIRESNARFEHKLIDNFHTYRFFDVEYTQNLRNCIMVKVYEKLLIKTAPLDLKKLYNLFKNNANYKVRRVCGDESKVEWNLYFKGSALDYVDKGETVIEKPTGIHRMTSEAALSRAIRDARRSAKRKIPVVFLCKRSFGKINTEYCNDEFVTKEGKSKKVYDPISRIVSPNIVIRSSEEISDTDNEDTKTLCKQAAKQSDHLSKYMASAGVLNPGDSLEIILVATDKRNIKTVINAISNAPKKLFIPVVDIENLKYYVYKKLYLVRERDCVVMTAENDDAFLK